LRIAIGIGRPESKEPDIVTEYVLSDVPPEELDRMLHRAFPAMIEMLKREGGL